MDLQLNQPAEKCCKDCKNIYSQGIYSQDKESISNSSQLWTTAQTPITAYYRTWKTAQYLFKNVKPGLTCILGILLRSLLIGSIMKLIKDD